jgi:hypothetical protein
MVFGYAGFVVHRNGDESINDIPSLAAMFEETLTPAEFK